MRDWRDELIWFIWCVVHPVCLVQPNRPNKRNQPVVSLHSPWSVAHGKGASLGEEAVLADSGRAGEVTARAGRVRRPTFSASCEINRSLHHTFCSSRSLRDAVSGLLLSEPRADSSSVAGDARPDHGRIGDRPPNLRLRLGETPPWPYSLRAPRTPNRMLKKSASTTGRGARNARKARRGQIGFPPRLARLACLARLSCVVCSCYSRRADQ